MNNQTGSLRKILALQRKFERARKLINEQDYKTAEQERTEQEKQELAERLIRYQEEFKQFAEFLREKFFEDADKNIEKAEKDYEDLKKKYKNEGNREEK